MPALCLADGTVVTEMPAILNHIADTHSQSGLAPPAGTSARAQADRWLAFAHANIYEGVLRYFYSARYTEDPAQADAVASSAKAYVLRHFALLDGGVIGKGRSFSVKDGGCGPVDLDAGGMDGQRRGCRRRRPAWRGWPERWPHPRLAGRRCAQRLRPGVRTAGDAGQRREAAAGNPGNGRRTAARTRTDDEQSPETPVQPRNWRSIAGHPAAPRDAGEVRMLCARPKRMCGPSRQADPDPGRRRRGRFRDVAPLVTMPDGSADPQIQGSILSIRVLDLVWRERDRVAHRATTSTWT